MFVKENPDIKKKKILGWDFSGMLTDGGAKKVREGVPNICHTYPTMMKLGTYLFCHIMEYRYRLHVAT